MLTPNDIRNITFTKGMGGYKTYEVDVFIDQCADTVEALMKERDELSKKLEVLADKLVEYRNEEDSIRTALLSAQRLGDTVVRESNHKAGLILEDANIKAQNILDTAKRNIRAEEQELARVQKEVANFKTRMLAIYKEHLSLIGVLPEEEEAEEAETIETATVEAVNEATEAPAAPVEGVAAPVEPVEVEAPAEPEETPFIVNIPELDDAEGPAPVAEVPGAIPARNVSRFGDLKFGDAYDISKDTDDEAPSGMFKRKK